MKKILNLNKLGLNIYSIINKNKMNDIKTNLIVATDLQWGISKKGLIPWRIKEDSNFFLDVTKREYIIGKKNAIIMGKNTWKALPDNFRGLRDRINIIISSQMTNNELLEDNKTKTDSYLVKSLNEGIKLCKNFDLGKIFIGGGNNIYKEALENLHIDEIYLSQINNNYDCDNIFPIESFNKIINNYKIHSTKEFLVCDQISKEKRNIKFTKFYKGDIPNHLNIINAEEQRYLDLLESILRNGDFRETRNANTWSQFGKNLEFDLSNGFPLLTTKKVNFQGIFEEALFFLSGKTDAKILSDKGIKIWDKNTSREFLDSIGLNHYDEFDMGPMYGFNFRHFGLLYEDKNKNYKEGFDQIKYCLDLIKNDPNSRRIIMTSFNPAQAKKGVLYPCHSIVMQWYVEEKNKLALSIYNRSQDMILGNPWNITYAALLIHLFCEVINNDSNYLGNKLLPGRLIMNLGDIHIYENHYEQCIRQILREPYKFPQLIFKRKVTELIDFKFEDLNLVDYYCYPGIIAKMIA